MNYRREGNFQYGEQEHASGDRYGDSEHYIWESDDFRQSSTSWFGAGEKAFRALPWVGVAAIGLGLLIIAYPMLLVMAVSSVFFLAGALCLALWWSARDRSQAHFDTAYAWNRFRGWLINKIGTKNLFRQLCSGAP